MFLEQQILYSAYLNHFWRSCDTEDWSNDAENVALHHRNKWHFKIYSNRKQLFEIVIIFHKYYSFAWWPSSAQNKEISTTQQNLHNTTKSPQHNKITTTQHNTTQHNTTQSPQHNTTQHKGLLLVSACFLNVVLISLCCSLFPYVMEISLCSALLGHRSFYCVFDQINRL